MRPLPILAVLSLLSFPARAADLVAVDVVGAPGAPVHPLDRVDVRVTLDRTYADPFDPAVIAVTATLENGLDELFFEGFWYQDYDVASADGLEHLVETGEPAFLIRLRAPAPGTWRLWVRATDPDGDDALDAPLELVVTAAASPARGFVRRVPGTARLAWDDGTPYVPFGANVCWADGLADFERYFDRLAENGLNWTRVWMTHFDATALEWSTGDDGAYQGLGRYNLKAAWRVDRILQMAEERGIALQLVLQQHSQFECANWSSWDTNPWNAANGGPLVASGAFFTDPDVVAGFDRKVHYLVARYAHSPALLAWELFNEIELISGARKADLEGWMHDRATKLKALDPYRHLVTTSYSAPCWAGCSQPWDDDAFDLTQVHSYLPDYWMSLSKAGKQMRTYGKPVIAGEVGIDFLGEKNLGDTQGVELMNMTLLAAMSGFAGGAMSWWWDSWLEPNDLWSVLGNVARALNLAGIEEWTAPLADLKAEADVPVEAFGALLVEGGALLWLHDPRSDWDGDLAAADATDVVVSRIDGPELSACSGEVGLTFFDPWTGKEVDGGSSWWSDAPVQLPGFRRDLLVRTTCRFLCDGNGEPWASDEAEPLEDVAEVPLPEAGDPGMAEAPDAALSEPMPDEPAPSSGSGGCALTSFR